MKGRKKDSKLSGECFFNACDWPGQRSLGGDGSRWRMWVGLFRVKALELVSDMLVNEGALTLRDGKWELWNAHKCSGAVAPLCLGWCYVFGQSFYMEIISSLRISLELLSCIQH